MIVLSLAKLFFISLMSMNTCVSIPNCLIKFKIVKNKALRNESDWRDSKLKKTFTSFDQLLCLTSVERKYQEYVLVNFKSNQMECTHYFVSPMVELNDHSDLIDLTGSTLIYPIKVIVNGITKLKGIEKQRLRTNIPSAIKKIALLNDKKSVALTFSSHFNIKIFDMNTMTFQYDLRGHASEISSLLVLKNGDLVSTSQNGFLILWDLILRRDKLVLRAHIDRINGLVQLENNDVITGSTDTFLKLWNSNQIKLKSKISIQYQVAAMVLLPYADLGAVGFLNEPLIIVYDFKLKQEKYRLSVMMGFFPSLAILPNGDLVGGNIGKIHVWDLNKKSIRFNLIGQSNRTITSLTVLSNGQLASGSNSSLIVWDMDERSPKLDLNGHTQWVRGLVELPNGTLISVAEDPSLISWN